MPFLGNDYDTTGRAEAKEPKTWYNTVNQERGREYVKTQDENV
jgi:hypothetical protein